MITSEDIIDHIGKMQAVSVEHLNKSIGQSAFLE